MTSLRSILTCIYCLATIFICRNPLIAQDEYQDWLKRDKGSYQKFQKQEDEEFSTFLKAEWESLNAFQGIIPDTAPKPVNIPVYIPPMGKVSPKILPVNDPVSPPELPEPKPTVKPMKNKEDVLDKVRNSKSTTVHFLGLQLDFEVDKTMSKHLSGNIDKRFVSDYWDYITATDYVPVLKQVMAYRQEYDLNDWGYGLLLKNLGQSIYKDDNLVNLFTWFMLLKSGYDARVGYNSDSIILLLSSVDEIYGSTFFKFEGTERRYYALSFGESPESPEGSLFIYKGDYAGSESLMDFSVRKIPTLGKKPQKRVLKFSYKGTQYSVDMVVSKEIAELYNYYPLTPMSVFMDAAVSEMVDYVLLNSLGKLIKGKAEAEAVNLLLRFVQTAFKYQTDDEQFGREKYLIPDETLFYSYSDCEDRSILFAHLVRKLVGVPVIGLDYPGHIATAVNFTGEVTGDAVQYGDTRYVICDPTYINADIGMAMPQFKDTPAVVIGLQ